MPKRTDIKKILIIGAGPILIGQACEFDYSGTQGVKALREEGFEVILINSNPATIMTDPELADKTYIEPITADIVTKIIEKERPDALLPTLGGQTALNVTLQLHKLGVLKKFNVELIGANVDAIRKAEDRELFKNAMQKIGLKTPRSAIVNNFKEALQKIKPIGFPTILRPAFTMGGTGGGIAYNLTEYKTMIKAALNASPTSQVLVEQSVLGWKEFELEVVRDTKDNAIIVCSIENFDPMGVHTGDSITVAPAQTLTDKEYQYMRGAALAIIREIGVETGGSNIQFGVNPKNGELVIIEMNPRVSRSSALASKATGFPIAKIAAKLSVGYTLDELQNDITKNTPACFEPVIDYVITKIPRFAFEKFRGADDKLTTQMKSVGEVMAMGRTFQESLQKAMRSLEVGSYGFEEPGSPQPPLLRGVPKTPLRKKEIGDHLSIPRSDRLWWIGQAFREKWTITDVHKKSKIDPWFLAQIEEIIRFENVIRRGGPTCPPATTGRENRGRTRGSAPTIDTETLRDAKRMGFSDRRLATLLKTTEDRVRALRQKKNILPVYKKVDTCAAEFEANTPYLYSTYESENEAAPTNKKKVVILGGGPNRIGQGIEFDYCCCHACFALKDDGYEVIMVNCNPETVSTDYDTSDRLYFEPLTQEDVLRIIDEEKPLGVIVQFGGQTPLKLAVPLEKAGVKILGTSSDSIDRVEDRERFSDFINKLGLKQPPNGLARNMEEAIKIAGRIGYPLIVRPSYVLGGRAMEIVYEETALRRYLTDAVQASNERPVLIDHFLENAIEVDVDALCDGTEVMMGGIMEHIEYAGVHSGDSACCLPPHSLKQSVVDNIISQTKRMALALNVVGLMNVQFAVLDDVVYILEVNPRASRTVPFVSKATGLPIAKIASRLMMGTKLKDLGLVENLYPEHKSVKEAVFPFNKFPGSDTLLGPEMKSTGEVMGVDASFPIAFAKSQLAAGNALPTTGKVFISVRDKDKAAIAKVAQTLVANGFTVISTRGTAMFLRGHGVECEQIIKHYEGSPNILDQIREKQIAMVINTHEGSLPAKDSYEIRRHAIMYNVTYVVTITAAQAAAEAIAALKQHSMDVRPLQDLNLKSFKYDVA